MTHPTKAIYKMLLTDFVKVSNVSVDDMLYNEEDINKSMEKIEQIHYHQHMQHNGIKFWCYNAGHVLGAAMFMIEIAGVRILYTGDFSRQEDRHLMEAELPEQSPDVLIVESTYGVQIHEPRKEREARFTKIVHDTVARGGRVLIPVFALGRAQELLLILDEYWKANPALKHVPIYFASSLGKKCMTVYQTYIDMMNERLRRQYAVSNPWVFQRASRAQLRTPDLTLVVFLADIKNLKSIEQFHDNGPSVVMASPGMLQSGLSRELFEMWCTDPRNTVVLAGYCVEGTLAKHIMSEPQEITSLSGRSMPLKMSVHYISFSAHSDFIQTAGFVDQLQPPNIILVHGDRNEMNRLKGALVDKYAEKPIRILTPRNCQPVTLQFKTEKMCRVLGTLADKYHESAQQVAVAAKASSSSMDVDEADTEKKKGSIVSETRISGVLVSRDGSSEQTLVELGELHSVTQLTTTEVAQSMRIPTNGVSFDILAANLQQVYENATLTTNEDGSKSLTVQGQVTARHLSDAELIVEWGSSPMSDMIADSVIALLAHCQTNPFAAAAAASSVKHHAPVSASSAKIKPAGEEVEQLGMFLSAQFGDVKIDAAAQRIHVSVDNSVAVYHHDSHTIEATDEELASRVSAALVNATAAMAPITEAFPRPKTNKIKV